MTAVPVIDNDSATYNHFTSYTQTLPIDIQTKIERQITYQIVIILPSSEYATNKFY